MAQFIVRNLENDVKVRLKRRAARHGRSMEEEVRHILRDAVKESRSTGRPAGVTHCGAFREEWADHRPAGIARSASAFGRIR